MEELEAKKKITWGESEEQSFNTGALTQEQINNMNYRSLKDSAAGNP